jgi:hypothetical protein
VNTSVSFANTIVASNSAPTGPDCYSTICVFQQAGSGYTLLFDASIPAQGTCGTLPCWKNTVSGRKFSDKSMVHDGISRVLLSAGEAGKSKAQVKGKGANLALPDLAVMGNRVVAELRRQDDAACWSAQYNTNPDNVIKNDSLTFKAKSD